MRMPLIVPAAFTFLLAAQPTPQNLVQVFNAELKGINQLMAELKFEEAVAKSQSLIPSPAPVFDGKDGATIAASLDNGRGMLALLKLNANTVSATGQWEKAAEVNQKRLAFAKALQADLDKTMTTLEGPWIKAVEEGKAYIAQNGPKLVELEKSVAKLQQDIKDHNEKKVVLDKKQLEEIQKVRIPVAQRDDQEIAEIKAKTASYQDAIKRYPAFQGMVAENRKEVAAMVKESEEALEKAKASIASQADEIAKFNTTQLEKNKKNKKFKIDGNKNWVEAVMNDKTNITKLDSPRTQALLLNRILVLDPTNKLASSALGNLKAGREPFFVEKKGKKGGKK
ncbi:MAG: hypothetical protein Q8O00_08270 [Holophaga sp.]|nr:hypothetical protein [Holophaga sp.]